MTILSTLWDELLTDDGKLFTEELKTIKKEKKLYQALDNNTWIKGVNWHSLFGALLEYSQLGQEMNYYKSYAVGSPVYWCGGTLCPPSFLLVDSRMEDQLMVRPEDLPHSSQFVGLSLRIRPFCSGDGGRSLARLEFTL